MSEKFEVIKTGFNVWEFRVNGITRYEGTKKECESFKDGYLIQMNRSWWSAIKEDKGSLMTAAGQADKAMTFIISPKKEA